MRVRPSASASRCSAFNRGFSIPRFLKYAAVDCNTSRTVMTFFDAYIHFELLGVGGREFAFKHSLGALFPDVCDLQRLDQLAEIAVHYAVQIIQRQANAVVGHAVLWEIVRANFFFAAAGANLTATLRAVFFRFLALLSLQQARPQDRHRFLLVLELTTSVLTTNDRSSWNVHNLDRRIGRIHALSARTASARNFNPQIFRL